MRTLVLSVLALLASFVPSVAPAQAPAPQGAQAIASPAASPITVWLMTVGQGDEVWELFGHNAIRIRDESRGTDVAYNWGMFSFTDPDFLVRFLTGDTRYWMAGFDWPVMLQYYREHDRSIYLQRLDLTSEQAASLRDFIEWNAREENKYYRYDYFLDNCSTRVRDALDRATGGALRRALAAKPTGTTYRWHTRRLTQRDIPTYTGIEIALGEPADQPISAWDESFLPMRLREHLRAVRVHDASGAEAPLVAEEDEVFAASRAPEPAAPPRYLIAYLIAGLVLALAIALPARAAARGSSGGRAGFAIVATLWSFVAGLLGVVLVVAWTATRHIFWYRNENVLQLSPLLLVAAVMIPLFVRRRGRARSALPTLATLVGALSVVGFVLQLVPAFDQVNGEIIALALPANLALAWGARAIARA